MTLPALQGRSLTPAATAAFAVDQAAAVLDVRMTFATKISQAGDMLPKAYRGNPGGVLLAMEWAESRGIDLVTTMQTVSMIDGKPVIAAQMQSALANRHGYDVVVTEDDEREDGDERALYQWARAAVWRGERDTGKLLGTVKYTLAEAETAPFYTRTGSVWKTQPRNMLVAAATRTALRFHAPEVLLGMIFEDEVETATDALTAPPSPEPPAESVAAIEPPAAAAPAADGDVVDVVDAEVITDPPPADAEPAAAPPAPSPTPPTSATRPTIAQRNGGLDPDEVKGFLKIVKHSQGDLIAKARGFADELHLDVKPPATLADVCSHPSDELRAAVVFWLNDEVPGE